MGSYYVMLNKYDLEQWNLLGNYNAASHYDENYGIGEGDIEFLLSVIGSEPKNILEVCCGTGRIFIPLAKAGHNISGFDCDFRMLERLHEKAKGLTNVKYYYAEALKTEWEKDFDVVLVAFNVLQNIEVHGFEDSNDTTMEAYGYKKAQEQFISKAVESLKQGGYFFLAFEMWDESSAEKVFIGEPDEKYFADPEEIDMSDGEVSAFGVRSKSIGSGSTYDPETRMARYGSRDISIYPPNGEKHISEWKWCKRLLKLDEVREWIKNNGLVIEQEYGGYNGDPIKENEYNGAVVFWAKKI